MAEASRATSRETGAPFPTLRAWLRHLAATGRVAEIAPNVGLRFELAAIAKKLEGKQAMLFPSPDGHPLPGVSGVLAARAWMAAALGVPPRELLARVRRAADAPRALREVPRAAATCQEAVVNDIGLAA